MSEETTERRASYLWAEMDAALNKSMEGASDWFTPIRDDTTIVRLLPGLDKDPPYVDVYEHFNLLERGSVRCLGGLQRDCPSCVISAKLVKLGDALTKGSQLRPEILGSGGGSNWKPGAKDQTKCRSSRLMNVVPRGLKEPQVQIWQANPSFKSFYRTSTTDKRKQAEIKDSYWNPWDPERGRDLGINRSPREKDPGKKWRFYWDDEDTPVELEGWEGQLFDLYEKGWGRVTDLDSDRMVELLQERWDTWLAQRELPSIAKMLDIDDLFEADKDSLTSKEFKEAPSEENT